MKKLSIILGMLLIGVTMSLQAQDTDKIVITSIDSTHVDSLGNVIGLTGVDFTETIPKEVKGAVLTLEQLNINIDGWTELVSVKEGELSSKANKYKLMSNKGAKAVIEREYQQEGIELNNLQLKLFREQELKKAYLKAIKKE